MADIYGVVPDDIAAELRGLFPFGFDVDTVPTDAQVTAWISVADTIVSLHLIDSAGQQPALTDAAASLVQSYIREWVKNQVIRTVYAGQDAVQVAQASKPYSDSAKEILAALDEMGSQAVGLGTESPRIGVAYTLPQRDLLVTDDEMGLEGFGRTRKY